MARDFIRQVQQLRKEADLQIQDRIRIHCESDDPSVTQMLSEWSPTIREETLGDSITPGTAPAETTAVPVGSTRIRIWISRS